MMINQCDNDYKPRNDSNNKAWDGDIRSRDHDDRTGDNNKSWDDHIRSPKNYNMRFIIITTKIQ